MSVRPRVATFVFIALFCCGLASRASADPGNEPAPPNSVLIDQQGIDLFSGRRIAVDSHVKIGLADAADLELGEGLGQGFSGTPLGGFHYTDGSYPYFTDFFVLGARGESNSQGGGAYYLPDGMVQSAGSGGGISVTEKDGTKWNFAPTGQQSPYPNYYLTSLVRPDGEILTYAYSAIPAGGSIAGALKSIRSSAGYQMNFQWSGQGPHLLAKVTLTNRRYAYCDPLTGACTGSYNWPNIAWSTDAAGNTTAVTSGARSVVYSAPQRGPQVSGTSTNPIYEWNTTVTSGAGVQKTFTNRYQYLTSASQPLYYGRPLGASTYYQCVNESTVWRVQDAAGTWVYNYTYTGSPTTPAWATYCGGVTRSDPLGKQLNRSGDGSVVDELGRRTSYTFVDQWNSASTPSSPLPDLRHQTSRTMPEGNKVTYTYDFAFNVTGTTLTPKPGSTEPTLTWSAHFPASCSAAAPPLCSEPDYTVDPRQNRTDYTYDPVHGGVLTKTSPADSRGIRPQTRYSYQQLSAKVLNSSGQLVSETPIWKLVATSTCRTTASCAGTADETVTEFTYDDNLLPKTITVRAGDNSVSAMTTDTYDEVGNLISVDGPLAGAQDTTVYKYDALRRLTATMQPDPDGTGSLPVPVVRTTYNADNQATLVETGSATAQTDAALSAMIVNRSLATTYDNVGRKIKDAVIGSNGIIGSLKQYSYDADSRLQCVAQRMNPTSYSSLPTSACTLGTPSPTYGPDRIATSVYDDAGQLVQQWKGTGTANAAAQATRSFTNNGKLKFLVDANGNKAEMRYDGLDRQVCWLFPSSTRPSAYDPTTPATALASAGATNGDCVSTGDFESYKYDNSGNRTSLRKRDGRTISFSYDALNRVTLKDLPGTTADIAYTYDLEGHQLSAAFADTGTGITNAYNAVGELVSSTDMLLPGSKTLSYQYDGAGNRIRLTHPDGTYFTQSFDALSRPTAAGWPNRSGTTSFMSIAFDSVGRRSRISRGSSSTGYGFDEMSRLSSQCQVFNGGTCGTTQPITLNETLAYNPAAQITSEARDNDDYAFNGLVSVNRNYTSNGLNQYSGAGSAAFTYDLNGNLISDGKNTYTYDVENRLTAVSGARTANLTYDPLGRLASVDQGSSTSRSQFLYDGDELAIEYDGRGNIKTRFVFGPNADEPILADPGGQLACTNGTRFLHTDHQGSIVALADCSGNRTSVNTFDEHGIPSFGNTGRFQYTGQMWMPELGMYYYKARMYSPTLGRYMQVDPLGYEDQTNLYGYNHTDSMNTKDPNGLKTIYIGGAADDWFTHIVKGYSDQHGGTYYSWTDDRAIRGEMQRLAKAGEPVVLVGHSLGGSEALRAAQDAGVKVNLLVTIDPVGTTDIFKKFSRDNIDKWIDVKADPKSWVFPDDYVANAGGKTSDSVTSLADKKFVSPYNHGDFDDMIRSHNIDKEIQKEEEKPNCSSMDYLQGKNGKTCK